MPKLINGDCLEVLLSSNEQFDCCFADPPDGIDLNYNSYNDKMSEDKYCVLLVDWLYAFTRLADCLVFLQCSLDD
jgi:DNA modification methylase